MQKANNSGDAGLGDLANLRRLVYFVAVVETGSFTAAAERIGVTKAVVSQQVARLEQEFRTSLLIRSTRKVQTTDAGQAFYQRCTLILREAEQAFSELADIAAEPSGTLRITAPFDYGCRVLVPAMVAFQTRYPNCKIDARFNDQILDLMSGDVELAIRVGWLPDSNLQSRKIASFRQQLVAAPALAARLESLTSPKQLVGFPFVANTALREPLNWRFTRRGEETQSVTLPAALWLDTTLAVCEAVKQGAGLSVLPDYTVADDLQSGALVAVLPQWVLPSGGIYAVFPAARFRPVKVRAFVDFLVNDRG